MLGEGRCSEGPCVQNQLSGYIKEAMRFPALQTWRQLGRVPGGQGNALGSACCLQARVPRRAEFLSGQGSSLPALGKRALSTGLCPDTQLQAAPTAIALSLTFLPALP